MLCTSFARWESLTSPMTGAAKKHVLECFRISNGCTTWLNMTTQTVCARKRRDATPDLDRSAADLFAGFPILRARVLILLRAFSAKCLLHLVPPFVLACICLLCIVFVFVNQTGLDLRQWNFACARVRRPHTRGRFAGMVREWFCMRANPEL